MLAIARETAKSDGTESEGEIKRLEILLSRTSKAILQKVKLSDIDEGPIRHPNLPEELVERIKSLRKVLSEVEPSSLDETLDGFKRDANPEREVVVWERISRAYETYIADKIFSIEVKKEVFSILLLISMGETNFSNIKYITPQDLSDLKEIYYRKSLPCLDRKRSIALKFL